MKSPAAFPLSGEGKLGFPRRLLDRPLRPRFSRVNRRRVLPVVLALLLILAIRGSGYRYEDLAPTVEPAPEAQDAASLKRKVSALHKEQRRLERALARKVPQGPYLVIDQTHNRLFLKRGDDVVLEAVCSAGSGMVLLESAEGGRKWVFDTPRGSFRVQEILRNPVWKKPDWAFIEEGLPIPKNPSERFEYGSLGEYALYFGNGYMIHGTLYERLLGRSVTHGCIRLGREDLRKVHRECSVGTRIFIY